MSSLAHYKNVKQLSNMIDSYERKLDDKVNQMFNYMINMPRNINDITLPLIQNKKIAIKSNTNKQFLGSRKKQRTQSIGSKSFIINTDTTNSQDFPEVDFLLQTFKDKVQKNTINKLNTDIITNPIANRSTGGQAYTKPKVIKKKPQVLSKEMRWDPFYEKNAVKAQQLNQGMLNLVQRGKIGKNVDIITAFQKGRPVLQTRQAIFHHMQQKFTHSQLLPIQFQQSKSTIKKQIKSNNLNPQNNKAKDELRNEQVQGYHNFNSSWALTMPEDQSNIRIYEQRQNKSGLGFIQQRVQTFLLYFSNFKLVKDQNFLKMKKQTQYYKCWGQVLMFIREIQKTLKLFLVQTVYFNGNKILDCINKKQCLSKITIKDITKCLVRMVNNQSKRQVKLYNLNSIADPERKKNLASSIISASFVYNSIRKKYFQILRRRKYERKVSQWIKNGLIIKKFRKQLAKSRASTVKKFEDLQKGFKSNFSTIQQKKHYQIHLVNRHYMEKFNYYQQFCNTQITRIFNLENANTNIIYVSSFQLNIDTINYYFKIMQLQQIENYNERVTFLQLEDITSKVKLPQSLNTSQKLYFSSKSLRKLQRKIQGVPSYFVINHPSQIDIQLAVFMNIPIYSGDFNKINAVRSALNSQRLLCHSIQPTPCLQVDPKKYNVFQFSNVLIRYCQSNKKYRKYILKINNYCSSAGIALLTYPFCSLSELYSNTVLVQNYYFKSIQKYFIQFAKCGGVVQIYQEGVKNLTVCAKIMPDEQSLILATFQKISSGFVNIGYIFPQKCISHKLLVQKSKEVLNKLASLGHIGYVQLTITVNHEQKIYLQQIQLYSTRITNSFYYFKFLAGGYLNHLGQFMTKITNEGEEIQDESIASMESRSYCYIPFMLHFGLTQKQTNSFFQLCRIGGISFDLQNKFGTTFIMLGSLKNTVGIISTAKDRKNMLKLISKSIEFLIKQNSHNLSTQMLKEKEDRMKQRLNVTLIKERIQQI